jgi:guanosine-3',5'-bis(diphosphate) 3'-pyrophosphohydrolase
MEYNRMIKAVVYAAEKHKYQRRKGFNQVPYINHPLKVSKLLNDCGEIDDDLLIAALLHDIIEDTDATVDDICNEFGKPVCDLVIEVTDDKDLPYAIRKELQVKNAPHHSESAKKLKIADKICNIRDIIAYPLDWSTERKLTYLEWSQQVVKGCVGVNAELEKIFYQTLEEGLEDLKAQL